LRLPRRCLLAGGRAAAGRRGTNGDRRRDGHRRPHRRRDAAQLPCRLNSSYIIVNRRRPLRRGNPSPIILLIPLFTLRPHRAIRSSRVDRDRPDDKRPRFRLIPVRMLLPNLITLLALCAGITAIRLAVEGKLEWAVAAIVFAAALDGIDGRLARMLKGTSRFG